jgi:hypothetical protein
LLADVCLSKVNLKVNLEYVCKKGGWWAEKSAHTDNRVCTLSDDCESMKSVTNVLWRKYENIIKK